jgi:hypothetical protein
MSFSFFHFSVALEEQISDGCGLLGFVPQLCSGFFLAGVRIGAPTPKHPGTRKKKLEPL